VKWWTTSWRAGCMLYLYGKSGTTYLYIHLNNDLTPRPRTRAAAKLGVSFAVRGRREGERRRADRLRAATRATPRATHHLHFEVHPDDGAAVNPFPYLNAGRAAPLPGAPRASFSLGVARRPVGAGAGPLRSRATSVRWWPGGQWTPSSADRVVTLVVAGDASVDRQLVVGAPGARAPDPPGDAPATTVTAFTKRGRACTPERLRGKPGVLVASRVTRPGRHDRRRRPRREPAHGRSTTRRPRPRQA
jgi:hypothetical protein